jgi:3-phosphoinositide dependent protein kinase-1
VRLNYSLIFANLTPKLLHMDLNLRKTESQNSTSSTDSRKKNPSDFEFGRILGEGSYSTVLYASEPFENKEYAVKVLDKGHIVKEKKIKYVTIEKDVLHKLKHPFCVKLYYTFQDSTSLYFVLEYCPNGDILGLLRKKGRFDSDGSVFYIAEIISAVEYIHSCKVIHRDLKPENILLDKDFHIKITDFGSAKILDKEDPNDQNQKRRSFVGTAEYCSPELLNREFSSYASDVWAIGCIFYQFVVGVPPFRGPNEYQTFQKILNLEYDIPTQLNAIQVKFIHDILCIDPTTRPTLFDMMKFAIFGKIDWSNLCTQIPPELPTLEPYIKNSVTENVDDLDNLFEIDYDLNSNLSAMVCTPIADKANSESSKESVDLQLPSGDHWNPDHIISHGEPIKMGTLKRVFILFT